MLGTCRNCRQLRMLNRDSRECEGCTKATLNEASDPDKLREHPDLNAFENYAETWY